MQSLLTVIVPLYNVQNYVEECITSLLRQTYPDFKVIIINDGSTDSSVSIINKLVEGDNRFSVHSQPNAGAGEARNAGIKLVTTEYIFFLDSDDHLHPDILSLMMNNVISEETDICSCLIMNVDENTKVEKPYGEHQALHNWHDGIRNVFLGREPAVVCGKLYRKRLFDNVRFPASYYEDTATLIDVFVTNRPQKITAVDKRGYYYRRRHGSRAHTVSGQTLSDYFKMLDSIEDILQANNLYQEFYREYQEFYPLAAIAFNDKILLGNKLHLLPEFQNLIDKRKISFSKCLFKLRYFVRPTRKIFLPLLKFGKIGLRSWIIIQYILMFRIRKTLNRATNHFRSHSTL